MITGALLHPKLMQGLGVLPEDQQFDDSPRRGYSKRRTISFGNDRQWKLVLCIMNGISQAVRSTSY
jgi:hypothetical protein